jgi:hypothetical protein
LVDPRQDEHQSRSGRREKKTPGIELRSFSRPALCPVSTPLESNIYVPAALFPKKRSPVFGPRSDVTEVMKIDNPYRCQESNPSRFPGHQNRSDRFGEAEIHERDLQFFRLEFPFIRGNFTLLFTIHSWDPIKTGFRLAHVIMYQHQGLACLLANDCVTGVDYVATAFSVYTRR